MSRVRKTYILSDVTQDGNSLRGAYTSRRRALEALRQTATRVAMEKNALDGSRLECYSTDEYRLVLPNGEMKRYSVRELKLDSELSR